MEGILLFNKFFRLPISALFTNIDKLVRWCAYGNFGVIFASCIFNEPRAAHYFQTCIFSLGHIIMWKYGRHPISDRPLRIGEEKEESNRSCRISASATQGGHNYSRCS